MPGGGNLVRENYRRTPARPFRSKHNFTRSLVVECPCKNNSNVPTRCLSAPKIMDSHSRSASPRDRPLHRPPSPPDSPTAFDNQGFQHEEDPNHNESFTSSASHTNGTNGHVKNEVKTLEAVNLELINMTPKKKEVDPDTLTNPYDEYFVPVNEHRKYMRGEKLYVTADKRSDKGGCKRSLCWTLLGLVVVAIVVLIVLAATGLLFSNTPTTLEQYNSSITSARALGGIGISQQNMEFSQPDQHQIAQSEQAKNENSIQDHSQYHPRNYMQGTSQNQAPETDFPSTSPDLGETSSMYVPQTVEGEVKIDNEEFAEVLQDPENDGYKDFATDFTAALRSALFSRETLNNESLQINFQVVQIRRGSIIVTYRVHWNSKANQYEMRDLITPTKLKTLLSNYLDKNNRMISIYHIAEDKITTRLVLDNCQINKNDCEYGCKFDESTLDFICTCPPSYILDMENQKKCMHILENAEDTELKLKEFRVLSINNSSKNLTSNINDELNENSTIEISTEITTEADMDLFLSHIMSDHKNQSHTVNSEPSAEPTPEPVQEQTTEPAQEPTEESALEPISVYNAPDQELKPDLKKDLITDNEQELTAEPAQEPTPEPTQEPTPEPAKEPSPKPAQEPSPESAPEPSSEPAQEPSLEAVQELLPDEAQEPSPEPAQEPTEPAQEPTEPAQEPTAELAQLPTSEPAQEPISEPAQEPSPEPAQEPTAEPAQEPIYEPSQEPTTEPAQEPTIEPTQEPTAEYAQEPISEPAQEPSPEPAQEPTIEPAQELTPEPQQEATPEPTQEPAPEPTQNSTPTTPQTTTPRFIHQQTPTYVQEISPEPTQEQSPEPSQEPAPETKQETTSELAQKLTPNSTSESLSEIHQDGIIESMNRTLFVNKNNGTPYTTTEMSATELSKEHLQQVFLHASSNMSSPTVLEYSTPITIDDVILESNSHATANESETISQSVLPLGITVPATNSEAQPTEPELSIKTLTMAKILELISEPKTDSTEHTLETKSKKPKQLTSTSSEKIIAGENNDSSIDSFSIHNLLNEQNTTPDNMLELHMAIQKLLNLNASENEPQNIEIDYLSDTKTDEHSKFEGNNENDDKNNNISLDDSPKDLTTTTNITSSSIEQSDNSSTVSDKSHYSLNTIDTIRNNLRSTKSSFELTTTNDIETTTISDWIQHGYVENKVTVQSDKSINFMFDKHDSKTRNDTFKNISTTSIEGLITDAETNDHGFSTTVLYSDPNTYNKENNETTPASKVYLSTSTFSSIEPISLTANTTYMLSNGDLYNIIQSEKDSTTVNPVKIAYENNTNNPIEITIDDEKEAIQQLEETTTMLPIAFKSKIETENDKAKKTNHLENLVNDNLKNKKSLYKNKLDNSSPYGKDEPTTTPDSDWLTESATEIKYDDKMNAGDQSNNPDRDSLSKPADLSDFERYYQMSAGSKSKSKGNQDSLYSMVDYDSEDSPTKREFVNAVNEKPSINTMVSNEIHNDSKVNYTILQSSLESTTVAEYIYKSLDNLKSDGDLKNTTQMINAEEPAPVWEAHEPETNSSNYITNSMEESSSSITKTTSPQPFTLQAVKIEEITSQSSLKFKDQNMTPVPLSSSTLQKVQENRNQTSTDLGNVTHLNNLNVTIYEISNQNLPTTKSLTSQTLEYEDHESEMNPFLPEVENNKSLVKKLQEGHDIEPINVNETQNENIDDGHNLPIYDTQTNKSSDIPKRQIASKNDLNGELNSSTPVINNDTTIGLNTSTDSAREAIPTFLKDTDDLDINHTTRTSLSIYDNTLLKAGESSTSLSDLLPLVTDDIDLNVVPLEHKNEQNILSTEIKLQNDDFKNISSLSTTEDSSDSELKM